MLLSVCLTFPLALSFAQGATTTEPRLMRNPAIHGDTLVFSYAGDLWVSKTEAGSLARRLTSHPGTETRPKISPDGKWVAFTGSYDAPDQTYLVSIEGGEPKRLTFGPWSRVLGWTPDGRVAYSSPEGNFTSRQARLWYVDVNGGLPTRTPIAEITEGSFLNGGKTLVYTRSSMFGANWRRYRGGAPGRISFYDFATNDYRELPAERAQTVFPMIVGRSLMYVSDKNQATLNLYRYDLDSKRETQLTKYADADIRWPNTDGKSIVWERDGYLDVYDIATGKVMRQTPRIPSEMLPTRPVLRELGAQIGSVSLSPTGTRMVAEARGEIFSLPVKSGDTRNMTRTSGVRERLPRWSPDGQAIAYLSDASGNWEVYTQPHLGGDATQLTQAKGAMTFTNLKWSPNGQMLELRTASNDVYVLDLPTRRLSHVRKVYNASMPSDWSPDSRWIALIDQGENRLGAVHFYEVATGKLTKVTEGYYGDSALAFDRNGKYLYLRSARTFRPGMGRFEYSLKAENPDRLYMIPLAADTPNPLRIPFEEEPTGAASPSQPDASRQVRVDLVGMDSRVLPLPMPNADYGLIFGSTDGVIYLVPAANNQGYTVARFDVGRRESQTIYTGPLAALSFNPTRTQMTVQSDGAINVFDVKPGAIPTRVVTSGVQAVIDPREEWRQIFWDAWRFQRDTFYDKNMLGLDWPAIGRRYEAYLPHLGSRSDLTYVIGLMMGELGTSHAYVSGGDTGPTPASVAHGYLGADYEAVGDRIRFAKVYQGESYDEAQRGPLTEPGYRVEAGEYLLEIDGQPVSAKINPHVLLLGKVDRYVTLTVNRQPSMEGARRVRVRTIGSETALRYAEWKAATRRYVAEKSGGRIGFMHVPSVLHEGAAEFIAGFYSQRDKEALIVDERWNVGGYFIQEILVEMLNRKAMLRAQERNTPDWPGISAVEGPKAMLINEYAGSGGDSFAWTFKRAGAGKLIGRRTVGALVGLQSGWPLIDGGTVNSPEMGIYDPKTGLLAAENVGAEPDIDVDMRPDLVAKGQDPQLDAAIKHLLGELAKLPPRTPRKDVPKVAPPGRAGS